MPLIGEIARRAGLRPSAIRYYESLGILPEPQRVNGRRHYDPDVLHLLRAIGIAKRAGFSMVELQQLFGIRGQDQAPSIVWEELARHKLEEIDALITRAHEMKALLEVGLRCGCLGWDECVLFGRDQTAAFSDAPSEASADEFA